MARPPLKCTEECFSSANILLTFTPVIFSMAFLTTQRRVMGQSWTAWNVKNLSKVGHNLLETGLQWTHCPQIIYYMDGQHCGDRGHHLQTPVLPLPTRPAVMHTAPTTHRVSRTAETSPDLVCVYVQVCACLPACLSVCLLLKWVSAAPMHCAVTLAHLSAQWVQNGRKQQSAVVDLNSQQHYKSSV